MPRTTKDVKKQDEVIKEKKVATKHATKTTKKATTAKKSTATKSTVKSTTSKSSKKVTTKSKNTAVSTKMSSSRTKTKTVAKQDVVEYYDLPYRYNQTIVKVLSQTPKNLFVYWDISDEDRMLFTNKYGDEFFSKTRPVLIVHNETMNYTFEVEINDFANSWYLQVKDADCKYVIELGRRPNLYQDSVKEDYIYVTSSNEMNAPNDHILFEKFNPNVEYKNVKTGEITKKNFSHLSNLKNMQEIYGIYDLYKEIYKNELFDEIVDGNLSNSSSLSSSNFS